MCPSFRIIKPFTVWDIHTCIYERFVCKHTETIEYLKNGDRKIAPEENCGTIVVRVRFWFTISVRIRAGGGRFSSGTIFLEPLKTSLFLRKIQTSRINYSRFLRMKNAKFSGYYFYMNPNQFQVCISALLNIFF